MNPVLYTGQYRGLNAAIYRILNGGFLEGLLKNFKSDNLVFEKGIRMSSMTKLNTDVGKCKY